MSTTRPTEAAWRWEGRSTSVRACRQSSRRCSEKRLFWHQKEWSTLCNSCEAVSSQDTFTPCSSEASLWLRFTSSQACELRGTTCGFWRCLRPAYSASMAPGSPWESLRHIGCYLCRRSRRCPRHFVLSEAMAHLVKQVKVVDNSHSPVSLTLTATSWGHRVLARRRPKPFPTQVPVGLQRQEEQFEWTWAAEEIPADLELAWLEWLRAAEAAWCRIHDLCGTQRRPFLGRSKGLVIVHVSLGQATRNDTRRRCSKRPQLGAPFVAWRRRRLAAWPLGGRGEPRRVRCNSQSTCSLQSRCPILAPGIQAGVFRHKKLWHTLFAMLQPVGTGPSRSQGSWFSSSSTHSKQSTLRQKEACQGSEGAADGFSKVGLDVGNGDGLAGPQLLVNQMGTWLPLWLDPRRANVKQLADQEDMGEPLP